MFAAGSKSISLIAVALAIGTFGQLSFFPASWSESSDCLADDSLDYYADQNGEVINTPASDTSTDDWSDQQPLCISECDGTTDCCCGDECDGDCRESCLDRLLGHFVPTDPCFNDFISPITNPVFFEDPRTLTEARLIFANHTLPPAIGGRVQLYALQVRAALTERLSFIATKDGFLVGDNGVPHQDGWADVAAGLKYNLYCDPCAGQLLSAGATFEVPVGSTQALQGNGSGEFNLFVTGGTRIGDWSHWISAAGVRLPTDTADECQVFYWSNHLDHQITQRAYVLAEVNWWHWMSSGQNPALDGIEGIDLYNFGSTGVAGMNVVSGAFGLKFKPRSNMEAGVAWEVPLTSQHFILDNRLTADFIVRY
jgi:hypothetical protein